MLGFFLCPEYSEESIVFHVELVSPKPLKGL